MENRAASFDHLVGDREHLSGTVRPSILAVSALMTSSNLLACTTGRSAGFAPLGAQAPHTGPPSSLQPMACFRD
jgi:hypothetical protein